MSAVVSSHSLPTTSKRTPQHSDPGGSSGQHVAACETCASLRATIGRMEKEKEEALREQNESFQRQLAEIARNRQHLEEERMRMLRHRLQQEMEQEMRGLRQCWKEESTDAVLEALEEARRQAEREREREMQAAKEAAELHYKDRLKHAVAEAVAEEQRQSEQQRDSMKRQQAEELKAFQEKICAVQEQLESVIREKTDFECQFKELQLNYKRFIDLTDSALHSDYLLRLIRLGKPPGYAHCAVQTDANTA
ncbi:golgin subfamily A member 6-like protein 7 [Pseudophryne corroboree]|uniref:golgin subfamily A member 6-like protein 7 n=1 Tax=Pseudophryne corroboree TaxID=495146 RepID=UPI003081884F